MGRRHHGIPARPVRKLSRRGVAVGVVALLVTGTLSTAGPRPAGADPLGAVLVSDTFQRTAEDGWGVTPQGHRYTATWGAPRLAVTRGVASMSLVPGATAQASLPDVDVRDVAAEVTVTVPAAPTTGHGVYLGPMVRTGPAGGYRLSGRAAPGGFTLSLERVRPDWSVEILQTSPVVAGVTPTEPLTMRLEATGSGEVSLRGLVRRPGDRGPAGTITATDSGAERISGSGGVAAWSFLSSGSEPTRADFSSLTVTGTGGSAPPAAQPPPAPTGGAAGSLPVGQARYDVPVDAVHVATDGSDEASGTRGAPYRTLTRALAAAPSGSTIVLRAGSYHESVMITREKRVTVQAHPGEAVWLDGSSPVTGFVRAGSSWVRSGWDHVFDASPTYARGRPDGTSPGWQFVDPAHPMAAHPDQVWVDDEPQTQVGSLDEVRSGTFFVDRDDQRLHLGTDPTGRSVRASTLQLGLTVLSKNSVVRGIGIRRYAPSVPDMGAVRLFGADGSTLENVVVTESATTGLTVGLATTRAPVRLTAVTASGNGLMGIGVNRVQGLVADRLLVEDNNREHFNPAPSAGGMKLTNALDVTVSRSRFADNDGSGLWFDVSSVGLTVVNNDLADNARHGLVVELSARARVFNNAIWGNVDTGLLVLDTNDISIRNNSVRGSLLPVRISDGRRAATDTDDPGHSSGMSAEATWVTSDVTVRNNVIGAPTPARAGESNWCGLLCVLDDRRIATAAQMRATTDGNLYHRATAGVPGPAVRWAAGARGPRNFATVAELRAAVGQEEHGRDVLGTSLVDHRGVLRSGGVVAGTGVAVPTEVAELTGITAGSTVIGAVR